MTDGMNLKSLLKLLCPILIIFCLECSNSTQLPTPEKIGDKELFRVISGKHAARVVNKMHGQTVAADVNVIVEYGMKKKDFLFISYYRDQNEANDAFNLMIEKMASSKKGPFLHLIPLTAYNNKVYFTLGMGTGHYIFLSGKYLLWFQTYQSFGERLPPQLLKFYPA
ncbi:MAG: hypothetical protein JRI93_12810 [Deltaproteobacteria bacterium]|nr:hypothetical protein [Deltaproteobacteria bacterium]